ncbi:uncharacterized protein LOC127862889 [Dreissena polymorpha]|uniref:Uncharacterized protein n=1 Tax=Dreissena polymorpha TaxID=45954 RepID=A0A9D4BJF5_DREPO|nr:uncharacterized protein LOC127862889 [Dreissena polymorpha]XP_052258112.1 uncharacterized protein LOC127862889 [Dreissena polymorpha]XP_052258113.1 uncharacterized protein LOC127862889 [Dreissena polymorpha]XP_052258114.1 uncharacterized protein LOC127862889 [Dreissena polymorpha]KAH3697147.1 hypothetical protein DPMN_084635 [Dreissena polymorpha]
MDWEKKFNSILNDTKASLSRVKRNKFDSSVGMKNVTWAPTHYSTPMKRSMSVSEIPSLSPSLYPTSSLNHTIHTDFYSSAQQVMPYPSSQTLLEKIEQQNASIDHLRGLVHRLETDRHNYQEQIRDLRNEIYQLTERATERRTDPSVERRVEQVRRELLGEMQLLQSQLQMTSAKGSNSQLSDTQLLAMNRDVLEIKHAFRDELESFRRDVEILRSRVAKLELELASQLSGHREVERRQDTLDRTLNSLSLSQPKNPIPSSTLAMMNTNRQLEKLQINELRSTLSALQGKIELLERSQQPLTIPEKISSNSKPIFSNGFSSDYKSMQVHDNEIEDDIDLSDGASSESSDFTEFELEANTKKQKTPITKQKRVTEDDLDTDDLDMDDLDLSDDDLSQNSLSDPFGQWGFFITQHSIRTKYDKLFNTLICHITNVVALFVSVGQYVNHVVVCDWSCLLCTV